MSYAENLSIFTVLLFGIIIVPGMDMLFVITNALTGGRKAGLAATAGITFGGVFHTLLGAISVGVLLKLAPSLFTVMIFIGAAYMAWIGYSLIRSSIVIDAVDGTTKRSLLVAFRQGAITCIINPKAYMFVMSVYPQFIKPVYGSIVSQALVMGVMTAIIQFSIYGGLGLAAGNARDFLLTNPRFTILIGRGAGWLFIVVAVLTAWHGWSAL